MILLPFSESWLHSSCDTSHLDLAGFQQVHRKDRSDDSGYGGVLAWVSSSLVAKRRLDLEIDQLELMWLEIHCNNNKFLVGVVYRPPDANDEFWQLYQESVESAQESDVANIIMIGDFNADPTSLAGGMLNLFVIQTILSNLLESQQG